MEDINKRIQQQMLYHKNKVGENWLDFSHVIVPSKNKEMNVICRYNQSYLQEANTPNDTHNLFYGASPKISSTFIINAIKEKSLKDEDSLNKFYSENEHLFMFHKNQHGYKPALSKYIALCIAYRFGIEIETNDLSLINQLSSQDGITIDKNKIKVHGCISNKVENILKQKKYIYDQDKNLFHVNENTGLSINDIYSNDQHYIHCFDSLFYSGVLLRPLKIEKKDDIKITHNVETYIIEFEKSTFGTVFAFDTDMSSKFKNILSSEELSYIKEFFQYEDNVINKMISHINNDNQKTPLEYINEYLAKSYNVHQMGVSANLITKDDYLLLGKRGNNQIDKQLLYPSANGNAEVISDKVEFYLNSARADLPTIDENNPFRMDFNGELSREVEAELGVLVSEEAWKIQGVAISGASKPETKAEITRRRMHFNVIMISKIDESFTDIEEKQKNSLESEETESMTGIKMHFYKTNIFDKSHVVYNTINFIYAVACILCCIILPQRINQNNQMIENIESIFLLLVSLINVYNTLIHIYKKIKLRIKVSVMHCKNKNFEKKFTKKLYRKHVFKKYKLHPITLVAINLCAELLYKNSKK